MARKRKTTQRKQSDHEHVTDTYTAELPSNVIHKVLSLLSTKRAAQAGLLSKEWGHLWSSASVLDIDEDEDNGQSYVDDCKDCKRKRKLFMNFMSRCLKLRGKDKCNIDRFRLHMRIFGGDKIVNNLLSLAVERNVKELEISFIRDKLPSGVVRSYKHKPFYLPQPVLNSAKSLTTLKLQNLTVKANLDPISLPCLKTMSLKLVKFRSQLSLNNLVSGCPCLESLLLASCTGVSNIRISSLTLNSLEVVDCEVFSMQVEVVNLESLKFHGNMFSRHMLRNFDIFSCQRLRSIEFYNIFLESIWWGRFNSCFPLLESLALHECPWHYQQPLRIYSHSLKRFVFSDSELVMPFIFVKFPNLSEARIKLRNKCYNLVRYADYLLCLRNFLENFDSSKKVILQVTSPEQFTFPEVSRILIRPPLPSLKHLEVETSTCTTALKDSLHWMAPVSQVLIHTTPFA